MITVMMLIIKFYQYLIASLLMGLLEDVLNANMVFMKKVHLTLNLFRWPVFCLCSTLLVMQKLVQLFIM
jgi:hypothetical protein